MHCFRNIPVRTDPTRSEGCAMEAVVSRVRASRRQSLASRPAVRICMPPRGLKAQLVTCPACADTSATLSDERSGKPRQHGLLRRVQKRAKTHATSGPPDRPTPPDTPSRRISLSCLRPSSNLRAAPDVPETHAPVKVGADQGGAVRGHVERVAARARAHRPHRAPRHRVEHLFRTRARDVDHM